MEQNKKNNFLLIGGWITNEVNLLHKGQKSMGKYGIGAKAWSGSMNRRAMDLVLTRIQLITGLLNFVSAL
jgi:hypothetical protein